MILGVFLFCGRQNISKVGTNHGGQWCFAFLNWGLRGYFLPRRERNQTGLPVLTSGIETLAR